MSNLMQKRRGLIMGVANDHSIAWGIAKALAAEGAELAFTYQGDAQKRRLEPLAESIGATLLMPGDVEDDAQLDTAFDRLKEEWGSMDFLVHAIAFSDRNELKGRYMDTSRANFAQTMSISCYSFTAAARRAAALMTNGGSMLTMTYLGGERVLPSYNVMGVAKAALEASVKYLAVDLGPDNIRVNAISAGPVRTLAGSGVGDGRVVFKWNKAQSPLRHNIVIEDIGGTATYLLSDLSKAVTGEIHFVDAGYNVVGMPQTQHLKDWVSTQKD